MDLSFTFSGSGVCAFKGSWPLTMERSKDAKWSEDDRNKEVLDMVRFVTETMEKAKVKDVSDLKGIPVECTCDGNCLKEWRILEEVL